MSNAWANAMQDARDAGLIYGTTYRGVSLDETTDGGVDITYPEEWQIYCYSWAPDQRQAKRRVDDVCAEIARDHYR